MSVNGNDELNGTPSEKSNEITVSERPIHKRRRKTTSCDSCRKMKTRCEVEKNHFLPGKSCHRCTVLKIQCSLRDSDQESVDIKRVKTIVKEHEGNNDDRLSKLENKMDLIIRNLVPKKNNAKKNEMINKNWKMFQKYGSVKNNYLDNSVKNSPNFNISKLDSKLFRRISSYEIFQKLIKEKFIDKFYHNNESLILKLGSDFLKNAHYWIIPGGITEITNEYVLKHPFITAVFVLISMTFDENFQYVKEQEELNSIVREILSCSLITNPLTDHDIEAILYCCIFNSSRKPLQPSLDTWSLSGDGIKKLISSINFIEIENRILKKEYNKDDLFHLRIWVSLNINHLFNSIGNGRPHVIPDDYYLNDLSELVIKFPYMIVGDKVNHYLLKLMRLVYDMFYSTELFENLIKFNEFETINEKGVELTIFKFKDLTHWYNDSKFTIELDQSGTLLFNLEFYYITLSKRFISFYQKIEQLEQDETVTRYLKFGYNTSIYYSIEILKRFLELPTNLIRGSPISLWNQVVYSCLTLYEFNDKITEENTNALNLISRIYWKLNQIGETKNDVTDTVGQIIKSLVDVNSHDHVNNEESTNPEDEELFMPLHDDINLDFSENFADVSKFDTFEEFFNDIRK